MSVDSTPPESLNERAQHLLRVLVQSYIRDGQPVGSRALSRDSGLSLSSATIRNVMADLEELGFVSSPHTSAGRVPTDRGYRFFVDALLRAELPAADVGGTRELARTARGHARGAQGTGGRRLAAALARHAPGGPGHLAAGAGGLADADRIRRPDREPRAGDPGVQRPRGAEPHHPARAPLRARTNCGARPTT